MTHLIRWISLLASPIERTDLDIMAKLASVLVERIPVTMELFPRSMEREWPLTRSTSFMIMRVTIDRCNIGTKAEYQK